jgi:hypothetical protein
MGLGGSLNLQQQQQKATSAVASCWVVRHHVHLNTQALLNVVGRANQVEQSSDVAGTLSNP